MSANEFKDLSAEQGGTMGCSGAEICGSSYPQCCFVTPTVFEAFGKGCTMRAGDLAMMEILWGQGDGSDEQSESEGEDKAKKVTEKEMKLLLFLWAIENS
jgi:hypothetical protein